MENPAGFWVRILASLLDAIIIGVPLSIISYLFLGFEKELYYELWKYSLFNNSSCFMGWFYCWKENNRAFALSKSMAQKLAME